VQLARQRPDADDGLQRIAERARVDLDRIAPDDPALLELAQPLGRAGRGQAGMGGERLQRHPGVARQGFEQEAVHGVDHGRFGPHPVPPQKMRL
jgi:hypothetical protein